MHDSSLFAGITSAGGSIELRILDLQGTIILSEMLFSDDNGNWSWIAPNDDDSIYIISINITSHEGVQTDPQTFLLPTDGIVEDTLRSEFEVNGTLVKGRIIPPVDAQPGIE